MRRISHGLDLGRGVTMTREGEEGAPLQGLPCSGGRAGAPPQPSVTTSWLPAASPAEAQDEHRRSQMELPPGYSAPRGPRLLILGPRGPQRCQGGACGALLLLGPLQPLRGLLLRPLAACFFPGAYPSCRLGQERSLGPAGLPWGTPSSG